MVEISHSPAASFDGKEFTEWLKKRKKNILVHYPVVNDKEQLFKTDPEQSDKNG